MTTGSFMKTRDMASMPHPPYAPDSARGDFHLSPTVKEKLEHADTTDEDQLFEEIHTILRSPL
jgi:hypothetical protein